MTIVKAGTGGSECRFIISELANYVALKINVYIFVS
jgi:hypothetical protein